MNAMNLEKKNHQKKKKKNEHKKKKQIETIIVEEDENFDSMKNTYEIKGQNLFKNNKSNFFQSSFSSQQISKINNDENIHITNKSLNTNNKLNEEPFIKNNNNRNRLNIMELSSLKSYKISDIKEESKNTNGKSFVEVDNGHDIKSLAKDNAIYNINNMMSILDEKMKANKGQINNLSINIFTPKTVQIPINQINNITQIYEKEKNEKKDDDDIERNKINEEININEDFKIYSPNDFILMNNYDKNSDFIYPNLEKLLGNDNKNNKDFKNNLKILLDNNINNQNIDNKDDNISNIRNNESLNKINKFLNLNNSKEISFTIDSMYENLNELSKYKFQTNSLLRLQTKKFILSQLCSNRKSLEFLNLKTKKYSVNFSPHHMNNLSKMGSIQYFKNNNSSISNDKDSIIKNKEKKLRLKRLYSTDYLNKPIFNNKDKSNEQNKIKRNKRKSSYLLINRLNKLGCNSIKITNLSEKENFYKNTALKRTLIHNTISENDDESYHSRHKTYRKGAKNKDKEDNVSPTLIPKKIDIEEQISKNIEKNKQNLNNPEEYFCGFFNDILQRRKTMRNSRMYKDQKRNINYFFKNKEESNNNNITSFKNKDNPENEITPVIKRNSTVKNEIVIKKVFDP